VDSLYAVAGKSNEATMIANVIADALRLQQAGRFADAARSYHSLLAQSPDNPDVLHLIGVLHHQNGYFARAIELIGRAARLRPDAGKDGRNHLSSDDAGFGPGIGPMTYVVTNLPRAPRAPSVWCSRYFFTWKDGCLEFAK
jgi:tetratricopeptide (TPR) repeat protein